MNILGIETSCDETSVAVIDGSLSIGERIVCHRILSQDEHAEYGGVVPEIAARSHLHHLSGLVEAVMGDADIGFGDLGGVAVTGGPGLIGGVLVGVMFAKSLCYVHDLPFMAVNHLEGHALTVRLCGEVDFPYLLLLVSGGHCQLLIVEGVGAYRKLGETLDDAVGESFDKTAKLLGLSYPGGPEVERAAWGGDSEAYALPRPLRGDGGCNFSFSGLKSSVRRLVISERDGAGLTSRVVANICASFQCAVGDILSDRMVNGFELALSSGIDFSGGGKGGNFVLAGGVSANGYLRERLERVCVENGWNFCVAPVDLCTDNGAMIGWAGYERLSLGLVDGMDFAPRPRWSLESLESLGSSEVVS